MSPEQNNKNRVQLLSEALPYIQKYTGKIFVVKYGGSALKDPEIEKSTINDLVLLNSVGIKIILVHGGGPEINQMLEKLGKEIEFEESGLRKTDPETMEVVEMVLHGKVQRRLVTAINCAGGSAMGLSGRDGRIVIAQRHSKTGEGNRAGEVKTSDLELIRQVMDLGMIPVISSIAPDEEGLAYNINADTMCAEIAQGIQADKMFLMTDTPGILKDKEDSGSLLTDLSIADLRALISDGTVAGGMIPKVEACIQAIESGVGEAVVLNGLEKHCLLLETFTDTGAGSLIRS